MTFASEEGNKPLGIFMHKDSEFLSFPTMFTCKNEKKNFAKRNLIIFKTHSNVMYAQLIHRFLWLLLFIIKPGQAYREMTTYGDHLTFSHPTPIHLIC